jgi:predicted nucleic acid-binding protein
MRVYVDTSVLVAAHICEPHTDLAQRWFSEQSSGLLFSMWTFVECDSALVFKRRRGELDAASQAVAINDIDTFAARFGPHVLTLEADMQRARALCRNVDSGLRAGDALHLAMALRLGASHLATLDVVLAKNATAHGIVPAITLPT